jgi:ribosomal protein RSM22 (predicted rRNA methylase)
LPACRVLPDRGPGLVPLFSPRRPLAPPSPGEGGRRALGDEKFIYLAASRRRGHAVEARILAPPRTGKGRINLKLCCADDTLQDRTITRRDGALFKTARRRDWGDTI